MLLFSQAPQQLPCLFGLKSPTFFADASLPTHGVGSFSMGTVRPHGCYRVQSCPTTTTLLHTELFGLYSLANMAAYEVHGSICLRIDSQIAKHQAMTCRAGMSCPIQNHLLCKLFWLRVWCGLRLVLFWVDSSHNSADPMSRVHSYPALSAAQQAAAQHLSKCEANDQLYKEVEVLEPPPWVVRNGYYGRGMSKGI